MGTTGPVPQVAIVGAGHIARSHAGAAVALGLPVGWVLSRTRSRAESLAAEVGAVAVDRLVPGPAVAVVCTPTDAHVDRAQEALDLGATVLVEKPAAATLADADRLTALAGAGGTVVYGENLLHAPVFRAALDRVAHLGRLSHLEADLLMPPPDWGGYRGPQPGGALFDTGAHPLALVLAAAGEPPVSVTGALDHRPGDEVDDRGRLHVLFGSGLGATVTASWRHPHRRRRFRATGEHGTVEAGLLPDRRLLVDGLAQPLPAAPDDAWAFRLREHGFVTQLALAAGRAVPDAPVDGQGGVDGGPAWLPDAAFGRTVLDVLCGAYASAGAGGSAVPLPFRGNREATPVVLWRGG